MNWFLVYFFRYIEGGSLADLVSDGQGLPEKVLAIYMKQVLTGFFTLSINSQLLFICTKKVLFIVILKVLTYCLSKMLVSK